MGSIFVRPVFSDPRLNQRASMFFNTVWTNFAVVSLYSAVTAVIQPGHIYSVSLPSEIFISLLTVFFLELSRRGRTTIACWCYIICCIVYVSGRAFYLGGIHSAPLMTMYCAVASMAGVLLGVEAGFSVALACLGIGLGFVILEVNGALPKPAFHYSPMTIALTTVIEPGLSCLSADRLRLKQILVNLLSNAVKFTPEGGEVTLTAEEKDGALAIDVCDTGIGMTSAQIKKALEPFGQIENSSNRKYGGTGLGLPIAKRLAELHGGQLHIESAPARGTKVTILMPGSRMRKPNTSPRSEIALAS